jgi:hypothetical protein
MRFVDIVRRLWWIFVLDAIIYVVNALTFSPQEKQLGTAGTVFEILSYAIVTVAAFLAARYSGRILDAIKIGALFWFIWRPIPFLISSALSITAGTVDYERAKMAALGYAFALLLFSPLALALCGGGGWFGRRRHQASST